MDGFKSSKLLNLMEREAIFFRFAVQFNASHKDLPRSFTVDEAVLEDFKNFLRESRFQATDPDLKENQEYIRTSIQKEVFSSRWGVEEGYRVFVEIDPQIRKALESFPQAQQLARLAATAKPSESHSKP